MCEVNVRRAESENSEQAYMRETIMVPKGELKIP